MSRIISGSVWGLALAAIAAFSAIPASAAPSNGGGANSPHIVLVRGGGGGGGGGGHGGGGFGGGGGHGGGGFSGGGFSGGGHSFAGGNFGGNSAVHSFGGNSAAHSFSGGAGRNFGGNAGNFANRGGIGHDGYGRGGWNNGNWAWHGNGYGYGGRYGGWGGYGGWGWGYPLAAWLGGYGWWYPGYYDDYGAYPYYYGDNYNGDNYAYADNTVPQSYTAVQPEQNNQLADQGGSEYLDQAVQDFQAGNYQNAMRMAEHAIVDSPRDAEAHEVVSLAAMANKDYRTAATEAHAVIALGGVPSWNQVYAIYQNVDAYTSQLRALEDYVKANPKSAEGQFLLGVQYMTTGYSSEAHDRLVLAAQLTPKDKIAQDLVKGAGGEQPSTANRPGPETK